MEEKPASASIDDHLSFLKNLPKVGGSSPESLSSEEGDEQPNESGSGITEGPSGRELSDKIPAEESPKDEVLQEEVSENNSPSLLDDHLSFLSSLPEIGKTADSQPQPEHQPLAKEPVEEEVQNPASPAAEPVAEEVRTGTDSQPQPQTDPQPLEKEPITEEVRNPAPSAEEPVAEKQEDKADILDAHLSFLSSLSTETKEVGSAQEPLLDETVSKPAAKQKAPKPAKKKKASPRQKKNHAQLQREEKNRLEQERAKAKKAEIMKQRQQVLKKQEEPKRQVEADRSPIIKKALSFMGSKSAKKK